MAKKEIYLNNIPVSNAFLVETSENLIVCNSIKEEFFGISTIKIDGKDILCEHLENNVVKCSVRLGNEVYNDIPFNLVVEKKANTKVAININTLSNPKLFVEKKKEELRPLNVKVQQPKDDKLIKETLENIEYKDKTINRLEEEIESLKRRNQQKQIIEEKALNSFVQSNIEKGVEEYKQKLFQDFFTINEEQSNIKNALIKEAISNLEVSYNEKASLLEDEVEEYKQKIYNDFFKAKEEQNKLKESFIRETISNLKDTFNEKYIEYVSELRNLTKEETKKYTDNFIIECQRLLTEKQDLNITELKNLVESTIKEDLFLVTDELQKRFDIQIDKNIDDLYLKLENYKQNLKNELSEIFESKDEFIKYNLQKDFDEKIASTKADLISNYINDIENNNKQLREDINQQFLSLQNKIDKKSVENINFNSNELVKEAAKLLIEEDSSANNKLQKFKDQLLKDLQKAAEQYATDANRRMMRYAEMMSGGGSTAMQFANGGTMDGDLNITGKYLSGGRDLYSIFSTITASGGGGGTGRDDVNTAVITNSANWNSAYNISTSYQTNSGQFALSAHAASHAAGGSDPLAPSDIGAQSLFASANQIISADVTLTSGRATRLRIENYDGVTYNITLPTTSNQVGDVLIVTTGTLVGPQTIRRENFSGNFTTLATISPSQTYRFITAGTTSGSWQVDAVSTHTHPATDITSGTLDIARIPTGTSSTQVALGNHTHIVSDITNINQFYFPLTGGIISGPTRINSDLTIFGNLTASGTTTFANTIFTTTSSLSVFHVGSGPALWVGNNGDGDIASFYDIDQNLEILHIGGQNGSFPNVGVKTSNPNTDFTVNGEISANKTIYDSVGNSTQWNQAFNIGTEYRSISSSFATNNTVSSVSSLLVTNNAFTSYQTNVASSTATLLPTSIYQNASGNWENTTTTVRSNSSSWGVGGGGGVTLSTVTNYLSTNSVLLSSINVQGNASFTTVDELQSFAEITLSALNLNLNNSSFFVTNLNSAITGMNFSNPPTQQRVYSFTLILSANGFSYPVIWPTSVRWADGTSPTLTTTVNKVDTFTFFTYDGGINYFGFITGQNS